MKNYKAPELEIVKFSHEDIMTNSDGLTLAPAVGDGEKGVFAYESAPGAETKFGTFGQ